MTFDSDKDFGIFDEILKRRASIDVAEFKKDLIEYYLPYVDKLLKLKQEKTGERGILAGVSAIQGAGKTTQGEILEVLLKKAGFNSVSLSIDDHYITHKELCELREKDPRFIRRGVTHDLSLATKNLRDLETMAKDQVVLFAGYDKGAQKGDGDRFRWLNPLPELVMKGEIVEEIMMVNGEMQKVRAVHLTACKYKDRILELPQDMGADIPVLEPFLPKPLVDFLEANKNSVINIFLDNQKLVHFEAKSEILVAYEDLPKGWKLVYEKPDFIFYDGWMLGVRSVTDENVFASGLPALETEADQEFARFVNKKLLLYEELWKMLDFLTVLYVPNYKMALEWRELAEKPLQAKGEGMTPLQIKEFVYYFWRSVHPAIQIKNLAHDSEHTNQVAIIGDDHTISEVTTPQGALTKYP